MGNLIYGYKNKLWKVIHNFQYTGEVEKFTLNPGQYLLICEGAQGGVAPLSDAINYGGSSYGILNVKNTQDFYATVGGNGGNPNSVIPGGGGFNGGGAGGKGYSTYTAGAGGGGGSDIRTIEPNTSGTITYVDKSYQQCSFIRSDGSTASINTGYMFKKNTKIVWNGIAHSNSIRSYEGLFGARHDVNSSQMAFFMRWYSKNNPCYLYADAETVGSGFVYDQRIKVVVDGMIVKWFDDNGNLLGSVTSKGDESKITDGTCPMMLFDMCDSGGTLGKIANNTSYSKATLYSFDIYEDNELIHHFIPCYRKTDNKIGVYDTIDREFKAGTGTFTKGDDVINEFSEVVTKEVSDISLYSRFIVAGGGGGGMNMTSSMCNSIGYAEWSGVGGGAMSGHIGSPPTERSTQTSGHAFGIGQNAAAKTSAPTGGGDGAGGGGGGWYGGYAVQVTSQYNSANGSGGSGYVLTKDSYKPDGYLLGEEYYLTDTFLNGGSAIDPQILICSPISLVNNGDKIIFPCVGETTEFSLPRGKYQLKCYGGDGGCRYLKSSTARGGYVCGTLTLDGDDDYTTLYATVGGSGIGGYSSGHDEAVFPTRSFNGGGVPGNKYTFLSSAGGGGTDIRIKSDSLYARVIVAGGAGGHGAAETKDNRFGGSGGGLTGAVSPVASGSKNYGFIPGPGTQTGSPTSNNYGNVTTVHSECLGGFGYGGNGVVANSGYGGAGGGGWYGGSGTYPDSITDNDNGGCGGSGYVLTKDSYKPDGYLLGEEYYLTDTTLITGGNTLPIGHTQAVIEVIEAHNYLILARDSEGYKYFDQTSNTWTFLSDELPADEEFQEYGIRTFKNDEGLLDKYDIIVKSDGVKIESATANVRPLSQTITTSFETGLKIRRIRPDADFDPEEYKMDIYASRIYPKDSPSRLKVETTIKWLNTQDMNRFKLYCVQLFNR